MHYLISNRRIEKDNPGLQDLLAKVYGSKIRPICLCRDPGIEMYIAKVGEHFIVKRMPNTGSLHDPSCDSFEPPPELSGLGEVMGSAIREDTECGLTELRFDFSMSRIPGRVIQPQGGVESDSVRTDGKRLTLLSMLHYLWEEAGFNRWTPAMAGKRTWSTIRKYLLLAAQNKLVKGAPLVERLYIPEPFNAEKKEMINARRKSQTVKVMAGQGGNRQLMIFFGEVKDFQSARFGYKMLIKHAPDFPFLVNDDMYKLLQKRYAASIELWKSLDDIQMVAVGTFSINAANLPMVEEMALMTVTSNWIPFENISDKALIDALTEGDRRFTKGLRYNLPSTKPLASVVLSDTAPLATAMYLVPAEAEDEYRVAVDALKEESHLAAWTWNTEDFEIPEFPPSAGQ